MTARYVQSRCVPAFGGRLDEHQVRPRVVSITQTTELGTVYSPEEIAALSQCARDSGLFLHVDGARFANAAAALDVELRAISADVGVDVLSFGGTKNGLLLGEAVVFFNEDLAKDYRYARKQGMQLASKMRFVSAQFSAQRWGLMASERGARQRNGEKTRVDGSRHSRRRSHAEVRGQRRICPTSSGRHTSPTGTLLFLRVGWSAR